jgi:hypothetical protein
MAEGWLLLLDWQRGPHVPPPSALWGLEGQLPVAVPFLAGAWVLGRVVDPSIVAWLPIVAALGLAGVTLGRLVGGSPLRRLPAGLLYAVNPFVYDRLYAGHVSFLLAYAVLPLAVASLLKATRADAGRSAWVRPVLWITLLVALTPHFAWIIAVPCIVLVACDRSRSTLRRLGGVALAVLVTNAYLVLPAVVGGGQNAVDVGPADLTAFRTSGEGLGVLGNVVGLHGFWRQEVPLPKDEVPGWPLFLAAILLVAVAGARTVWRRGDDHRLVLVAGGAGGIGVVLAVGDQGPAGAVYRWLFVNVPGFEIMREPQKFSALVALAYAVLFGLGAEALVRGATGRVSGRMWAATVLVLPIAATPTLFWGLRGRVEVSHYPAAWAEADRLMGDGPERILFLPWHQYLGFPFTGRVVANPASNAFRRDVIAGDNVELPELRSASLSARSAYLEFVYEHGAQVETFGQLVAPHGVKYVVVAKVVDWRTYAWLDRQRDLVKVLDRPGIAVYRNLRPVALGTRMDAAVTVEDWGELVGLSEQMDLSGTAVRARRLAPGRIRMPAEAIPSAPVTIDGAVRRRSAVRYDVPPGRPGWLVIAEPFDDEWRLDGRSAVPLAWGATGFPIGAGRDEVVFARWAVVRLGYGISLASVGFLGFRRLRRERSVSFVSTSPKRNVVLDSPVHSGKNLDFDH